MEMQKDAHILIILRRLFLATIEAMINVKNGKLYVQVGEEKLEFNLTQAMTSPILDDTYCDVDILNEVIGDKIGDS